MTRVASAVPNIEVRGALARMYRGFVSRGLGGSDRVQRLCAARLSGDAETIEEPLEALLLATLSHFDTGGLTARRSTRPSSWGLG